MYKSDKAKLEKQVEYLKNDYNFRGPLHLTDLSNLKNIFDKGFLLSRGSCSQNGITFLDAANQDVIEHTRVDVINCVRFYFKEKTPMLYNNEGIKINDEKPHIPIPVYLLFDNDLLYLKISKFADGNAKSSRTQFGDTYEFFEKIDWGRVFHRGPIYGSQFSRLEMKRIRHA